MLGKISKLINYSILLILIISSYFIFNGALFNQDSKTIFVSNENLSDFFIKSLPNNPKLLNEHLSKFNFIESFFFKLNNQSIIIDISIYEAFAKNTKNDQIIFDNGAISKSIYFKSLFIKNINIENINIKTPIFDDLTISNLNNLNYIDNIVKIELIDNRRLDIFLTDGRKVMLPKNINLNLINFLNEFLNSFMEDVKFQNYLDLRNFTSNSIRMK